MKRVPAGAVIAATLVLGVAPAAQADDVTSNAATETAIQALANHPTFFGNSRDNDRAGNVAGSVVNTGSLE
ncbi:hypothetical protein [Streptomyces yangpuensis]|uniref:hypothetical protein n=1 Tax=Streptomyces TaxID=1883 RepID=UPI00368774F7